MVQEQQRAAVTQLDPERAIIEDYIRSGRAAGDLRVALECRRYQRLHGRAVHPEYNASELDRARGRLRHIDGEKMIDVLLDLIAFTKLRV